MQFAKRMLALPEILSQIPNSRRYGRPMLLVFVLFYLGFHTISGEHGLVAWFKESRRLEELKTQLSELKEKREDIESKVKLMNSSSIDPDMLDEQSRKILGFARPDEVVILAK